MAELLKSILTNDEYNSLTFSKQEIQWLENKIQKRKDGSLGVECIKRGLINDDYLKLTPEECVRQLFAHKLVEECKYSIDLLDFETKVTYHGHEKIDDKRIDIAVYDKEHKNIDLVIEVKRPNIDDINKVYDGEGATPLQQMQSYCKQVSAKVGIITNGAGILKYFSKESDFTKEINVSILPKYEQDLEEWKKGGRWTILELMKNDRLQKETLKDIILKVEQRFAANDSSDKSFEELLKLIFIKLYDEKTAGDDYFKIETYLEDGIYDSIQTFPSAILKYPLQFRILPNETPDETYKRFNQLFKKAQQKWSSVFKEDSNLDMQPATLISCVKELYNVKLFNSNLEVVDEAFEHLVNQNQKESMGQYFTPRYVIDMCVKMLNPQAYEKMIDTASGSAGFPMHTVFHVWNILNPGKLNLMTTPKRTEEETEFVTNNVFGLDFSEKSVQVGRMLNIIAGDGHTNIIYINSLDYRNWEKDYLSNRLWQDKYREGFKKIEKLSKNPDSSNSAEKYKAFNFDILMANPPFAGDLYNEEQLNQYELSYNDKGKLQNKVGRDILFIERNLSFLKPGGRMAIVLPQGRFNNSSDKYIRDYIAKQCRILAVVGLHGNVFKPHTGTKTSVLFVQKWTDENCGFDNICPKVEDYDIFFATMTEPSKDNSGDKIFVTEKYIKNWTTFEYDGENVKSDYHANELKDIYFIKDLFVEKYGNLEEHQKYIKKNIQFVLKKNVKSSCKKETLKQVQGDNHAVQGDNHAIQGDNACHSELVSESLTIEEYLKLNKTQKALYKEEYIKGKNTNTPITKNEYDALPQEEKKLFVVKESITEETRLVKDTHGHDFVKHDLFNQCENFNTLTEEEQKKLNPNPNNIYYKDGIAEAFIEFAKKEGLSFF